MINLKQKGQIAILVLGIFTGLILLFTLIILLIFAGLARGEPGAFGQPTYAGSYSSLNYPSGADPEQVGECLDNWISENIPANSPLQGSGERFASAGQRYNVNPALLIAIAGAESSYGTNFGAIPRENHNYQSMTCGTSQESPCSDATENSKNTQRWEIYPSWAEAIDHHAQYMRRRYLNQGINTVYDIGTVYCGKTGVPDCPDWLKNTPSVFEQIINACPALQIVLAGNASGQVGLEAGHAGSEEGAHGLFVERVINQRVARQVKRILESNGTDVIYNDKKSYSSSKNGVFDEAKRGGAKLFVSIHNNDALNAAAGTVFYQSNDYQTQSRELANHIQPKLNQVTGYSRMIRLAGKGIGSRVYGDHSGMPFVLIEMSYVNDKRLGNDEFINALARAISHGITNYLLSK